MNPETAVIALHHCRQEYTTWSCF